jgi:hypothetical protein
MFSPVSSIDHFYRQLNLAFNFLVAGPLAVFILLYLEFKGMPEEKSTATDLVIYGFSASLIILGFAEYRFRKQIIQLTNVIPLDERLTRYLPIFLSRGLLTVFSCIIALVCLYLTYSNYFIVLFFICFGYLSLVRPTDRKLSRHLKFTRQDIKDMEDRKIFNHTA